MGVSSNGYRERALAALDVLPPFSPVLNQLIATSADQAAPLREVARIIQTDPVIAGEVLQISNSALYARCGTVGSISRAVALLGVNKLRNLAITMSLKRTLRAAGALPGWSNQQFNLESLTCALICDALARRLPVRDPEAAFAAGLLHHLGKLLIVFALPEKYAAIAQSNGNSPLDHEREVIGVTHAQLSGAALRQWNLPVSICSAAEYHHDPDREKESLKPGEFGLSLAIACADQYIEGSRPTSAGLAEVEPLFQTAFEPFMPLGIRLASVGFLETVEEEVRVIGGVLLTPD